MTKLTGFDVSRFALKPAETWKICEIRDHPGLVLIRNPFSSHAQRYWTVRCLRDFQKPPNRTNLSNIGRGVDDWWQQLHLTQPVEEHLRFRNSLRWVTLGYHHNWDTKLYSDEDFTTFPADLGELISEGIAPVLGYKDFVCQAAIVNYYPQGSTLSGHTDHSELNLDAPLFSISFGQSAIFLIGGRDKPDPASAILIRSGDVLVMTKESRLCYHAVPRIFHNSEETWNDFTEGHTIELDSLWNTCQDKDFSNYNTYLKDCRINLNVRQVLNKDQSGIV